MTSVGDRVIGLLELGDLFTWVTDQDRADALSALQGDPRLDATIAYLERRRLLDTMLTRYHARRGPSLFDLTMMLAARVTAASAGAIESRLRRFSFFSPESRRVTDLLGAPQLIFRMANDLSLSLARHGVATRAGACTTAPAATIPTSPRASFTGSGATGNDIFARRMPLEDQARVAWEQANHSGRDPRLAGPASRRYGNPLFALTLPGSASERRAQAGRIACLTVSSLFAPIYLGGPPRRAAIMAAAARVHRLTPEIVGGFILAEQRDQSTNEDMLDYTAATHSVARRTTSIGLAQVRDDTAARSDLFADLLDSARRSGLSQRQIAALLTCDEFNIFACARYIRQVANAAAGLSAAAMPDTVSAFPGINFAAYAGHGSTWPPGNIDALGSEYTSPPWDDVVTGWGYFVREAWNDMNAAGISW